MAIMLLYSTEHLKKKTRHLKGTHCFTRSIDLVNMYFVCFSDRKIFFLKRSLQKWNRKEQQISYFLDSKETQIQGCGGLDER